MNFYPKEETKHTLKLTNYITKNMFKNDLKNFVLKEHILLKKPFDLNKHVITGLNEPVEDNDVINYKYYLDNYKNGISLDPDTNQYTANNNSVYMNSDYFSIENGKNIVKNYNLRIKDVNEYFTYTKNYFHQNYNINYRALKFKSEFNDDINESVFYVFNNDIFKNYNRYNYINIHFNELILTDTFFKTLGFVLPIQLINMRFTIIYETDSFNSDSFWKNFKIYIFFGDSNKQVQNFNGLFSDTEFIKKKLIITQHHIVDSIDQETKFLDNKVVNKNKKSFSFEYTFTSPFYADTFFIYLQEIQRCIILVNLKYKY